MIATFYNSHKNYNNFTKMNKKLDDNHIEYKFNIFLFLEMVILYGM